MKKLISLILSAILTFSVIPNMDVKAASIKEQAGKAYADIIQQYLTAEKLAKEQGADAYNYPGLDDVDAQFINDVLNSSSGNYKVTYSIVDYNNDGIPELFGNYGIYTYHNGKAVQLASYGYRVRCILCKNGIIEITSGGGGNDVANFYKLPKNKGKLKNICYLEYDVDYYTNRATYYTKTKNKTKKISEEKYNKLYKKYYKPAKMTFYEADSKAVENMRNGIFYYPSQKKITVKGEV